MANIKDFIKKIGNETVSLEEQQRALAAVEQTIVEAKAKREESIGKNVDLVISALKKIESDLNTKLVELNNTPAKQGVAGPKGEKGRDGRDGKDGYKGQDGKDGVDGQDGKDGSDGVSVTDAKVDFDGSLVITLSDGREIDAGTIVSLDVAKNIHSVQTAGTGSTSQAVLDAIAAIQATIATYGTMATQNANAVAITGGTINGTTIGATTATTGAFTTLTSTGGAVNGTIGATTPAAGTFTTITGQTEVLKGTGQNLLTYSQNLLGADWALSNTTVSATLYTDPLGGTTANDLIESAATSRHYISASITTVISGINYTFSSYCKTGVGASAANIVQLTFATAQFSASSYANFNLNTGAIGASAGLVSSSITSIGNGWYRCSITATATATGTLSNTYIGLTNNNNALGRLPSYAGSTSADVLVWGVQLEIGSTLNTYIPTTTTAVYGTPTLSFSGVAGLGLQSDGSLYVSPAGTGALQAQATTSSTVGGNARGANAVDWQTSRTAASQVASGTQSVIGGGNINTASSQFTTVAGGNSNTASSFGSSVAGGNANTSSGIYSVIGGGGNNSVSNLYGFIGGGELNSAAGYYNFIGAGFTNSGTANAAVTTQSGTMNATTAVTLSGSNASIKVGQYITGTSIANGTYVAAISGTSLTLSKVASGSSTSTLSFFTPHGVVVGGGNNQATGAYSAILGGGDAGTAANRNVASGDWSFVGGGTKNTASGIGSFVGGGGTNGSSIFANTASNAGSVVVGGFSNNATGFGASVLGGNSGTANGSYSAITSGLGATNRSIAGALNFNASIASVAGDAQCGIYTLRKSTTDATASAVTTDAGTASTTNQVILPNNSAYFFRGEVVSGVTGGGDTKGWTIEGVIKRGAGVGTTTLVGSTVSSLYADAGAATWTIALAADTTNGGLRVTFTGQAATTIRTVCQIRTTEMTY